MLSRLTGLLSALVASAALAACATPPAPAPAPAPEYAPDQPVSAAQAPALVLLISIDGFRPDYLGQGATPVLDRLAAEGATGPMQPSFPSVTFPNHYTLVTGMHPDRHGVVANRFNDAVLGTFAMSKTESGWWDQAEPIWTTAEKAGVRTGAMFWPGSETEIDGVRPSRWVPFDQSLSGDARVDIALSWQDLPTDQRPRLGTLYFDIVDSAGHRYGPRADETRAAVASVDASVGRLVEGLKARGLWDRTVLLITSDHGMSETSPERVVMIDDLIDPSALRIIYSGAVVMADPAPGREAEVQSKLIGKHDRMECFNKADLPTRLAYGANPRVAAIICLVDTGWLAQTRDRPVRGVGGQHGYDNQALDMQALFIVHGPGVARGRKVEGFRSVDVQPLIGRLLNLPVPATDGDARASDQLLVSAR